MSFRPLISLLALGALVAGCRGESEEHTLAVGLRSDLVPFEEYAQVEVTLLPVDGRGFSHRETVAAGSDFLLGPTRLTSISAVPTGDYRLSISLLTETGRALNERPVLVELSENRAVSLRIQRACLNVLCPEGRACFGGECVDARCTQETPEHCGDIAQCDKDSDCQAVPSCGRRACEDSLCWFRPEAISENAACEVPEFWCHPEQGCMVTARDLPPASCSDDRQNGDEVGVDCGGTCAPCPTTLSAAISAHCKNGTQDEGESGVDCGGDCVPCETLCAEQNVIPVHECLALVDIYRRGGGDDWFLLSETRTAWLSNNDPCTWAGVVCSGGHVTELVAGKQFVNQGSGTLSPAIGNLSELIEIDLSLSLENALRTELGQLSKLEILQLGSTPIDGTIPPVISSLTSLQSLNLSGCGLVGSIPSGIGQLRELRTLILSGNQLTGSIPDSISDLTKLEELLLGRNLLTGPLPASLRSAQSLARISLEDNRISGTIPASLGQLTNLDQLRLFQNRLSGSIPPQLSEAPALRLLQLGSNGLTGTIPGGPWASLQTLDVKDNAISGTIPPELFDSAVILSINLSENLLEGTMPPVPATATNLRRLWLSENTLTGTIPPTPNGSALGTIHFDNNAFTGTLPTQLGAPAPSELYVQGNALRGEVPSYFQNVGTGRVGLSNNSCMWTTDCENMLPFLNTHDPEWQSTNQSDDCSPPSEACE